MRKEMEFGGLWRYWSSKNPKHQTIPPDLDDIACISHLLKTNNISFTDNTSFILANQNESGAFYTWVLPRSIQSILLNLITFGKALSSSEIFWTTTEKSDVCCVVNSNVLLYLGERKETQNCVKYLIEVIRKGEEYENTEFYIHNLSFYYMLSRAYYNGAKSLDTIKSLVINRVLALQCSDGSFGDELLTGLGVCTLLNFSYVNPCMYRAIDFILSKQQQNGCWKRIAMFGGKHTQHFFGSEALTTGFCVEALARYRLIGEMGNLQPRESELEKVQTQLQQTEQALAQSQSQLHTTQTELAQAQSELQSSKTELAQLKSYLQTQGSDGVMGYYHHAIATNPDDLQLYYQALEAKPDDAHIHLQLGNALVRQGQLVEAIARYQTALQLHSNSFELHFELAKTLEQAKQGDEAIAAYRQAIDLNPNHSLVHQHLGDVLAERGQLHEASTVYRRSLQLQAIH